MFDATGRNIHYLRLSVTDLCNLRCRYCMPDGVPKQTHEDILRYEEFLRLVNILASLGIDTVRVTGGEPLVRRGVEAFIGQLAQIPGVRKVTMTTNGALLAERLPALLDAGLAGVNISIDTLKPETFAGITGCDALHDVLRGLQAAVESGLPVKINVVPQAGINDGEWEELAALAQTQPVQVRFIEMMPIGYGAAMPCIQNTEVLARLQRRWADIAPLDEAKATGLGDGPAVYYTIPGWQGNIGFISAVHGKFCRDCNRVRLTSQGFLRLCLASEAGLDLRTSLRSGAADEELAGLIKDAVMGKPLEHHFGQKDAAATRGMYRIGG